MIIFLFGRPGSGKSTVGKKIAEMLGGTYFDCDDCYTEKDKSLILQNRFSVTNSDLFLERVIQGLYQKNKNNNLIVASQSLFRERQRKRLKTEFNADIFLIFLDVPISITIERLKKRDGENGRHFYTWKQYINELFEFESVNTCDFIIKDTSGVKID